jgi:hypothetical protein
MSTKKKISRRTWLKKVAAFSVSGMSPLLRYSSSAESKAIKSAVHYRDFPKRTEMCEGGGMMGGGMMGGGMMGPGMMAGECEVVEGRISRMGWCDLYAPRTG